MKVLKSYIEQVVYQEPIIAVVIQPLFLFSGEDTRHSAGNKLAGRVLRWEEAREALSYAYDDGFGTQDCHSIYVYTPTRVFYVEEYDGSTQLKSVPRNPTPETWS